MDSSGAMTRRLTRLTLTRKPPRTNSHSEGLERRNPTKFYKRKKRDAPNEDLTEPLADRVARKPAIPQVRRRSRYAQAELETGDYCLTDSNDVNVTWRPIRLTSHGRCLRLSRPDCGSCRDFGSMLSDFS